MNRPALLNKQYWSMINFPDLLTSLSFQNYRLVLVDFLLLGMLTDKENCFVPAPRNLQELKKKRYRAHLNPKDQDYFFHGWNRIRCDEWRHNNQYV